MKLIKQKTLYFAEGKSDKVYEVDLCESQDLFVVNFRYGRRGSNLREGTKTVFPVSLEEAETIYTKLIDSKVKKGYKENLDEQSVVQEEYTIAEKTILKYLKQALEGNYNRNWKVSKIIARAGVLRIKGVEPLLAQFIHSEDAFEQYNSLVALCQRNASDYVEDALTIFKEQECQTISGRASLAYVLKFGSEAQKEDVQQLIVSKMSHKDINTLSTQFIHIKQVDSMLLFYAYISNFFNQEAKAILLKIIEHIPLIPNVFKSIRYIYRFSALLEDNEMLGLIAKRIAISNAFYTSEYYAVVDNNWVDVTEEKSKPNPKIAFSSKTKRYFSKLTYQKIYSYSKQNTNKYIRLATSILCSLNDELDRVKQEVQYMYEYNFEERQYTTVKRIYPRYHNFMALMYILYGCSERGVLLNDKWYYTGERTESTPREEILPETWDKHPKEVLAILSRAKSEIAINFALRVIEHNPEFTQHISKNILIGLVGHTNTLVKSFALDYLKNKYSSSIPEADIVLILIKSNQKEPIQLALDWMSQYEDNYLKDVQFIKTLLLTGEIEVIHYLKELFKTPFVYGYAVTLDDLQPLFEYPNIYEAKYLLEVNSLIALKHFKDVLGEVKEEDIQALILSKSEYNKLFATQFAFHYPEKVYPWFNHAFESYIQSEVDFLRQVGIKLIGYFPDEFLLQNKNQIIKFCFSEFKEVREAIEMSVNRLVSLDKSIEDSIRVQAFNQITEPETYEGIHEGCYELLNKLIEGKTIEIQQIKQLVLSPYEYAQKLGTPLFEKHIDMSGLSMNELVEFGKCDVVLIRERLHQYFNANVARVNIELEDALLIFNSNWDDVVIWACEYFKTKIDSLSWTVEMLLYVCDHVKEEVQNLGRHLITTHFTEEKGLPLLIKLQEHPNKNMQFFVTNYLETYATNNVEVILKLELYFNTSLFNINTHRTTKTRIYSFLEQELKKHKEVALMTVRIIKNILDTKTVKDRSRNIDLLLIVSEYYPEIENPLTIKHINYEV